MRPLKAVVIAASKKNGIKIRLESGQITMLLPYNKKYHVGQEITVIYNFTKNKIIKIVASEYHPENMPKATKIQKAGKDSDVEIRDIL